MRPVNSVCADYIVMSDNFGFYDLLGGHWYVAELFHPTRRDSVSPGDFFRNFIHAPVEACQKNGAQRFGIYLSIAHILSMDRTIIVRKVARNCDRLFPATAGEHC